MSRKATKNKFLKCCRRQKKCETLRCIVKSLREQHNLANIIIEIELKRIFGKPLRKQHGTWGAPRISVRSFTIYVFTLQSWVKWHLTYQPAFFECIEVKPHLARLTAKKQQSLVTLVPWGYLKPLTSNLNSWQPSQCSEVQVHVHIVRQQAVKTRKMLSFFLIAHKLVERKSEVGITVLPEWV